MICIEDWIINEDQYRQLQEEHPDGFVAGMGAEAIKELLARLEVEPLAAEMRQLMRSETSQQKRLKFAKRLKVVDASRELVGHRNDRSDRHSDRCHSAPTRVREYTQRHA